MTNQFAHQFYIGKLINKALFGEVYTAHEKTTGKLFAVKQITKSKLMPSGASSEDPIVECGVLEAVRDRPHKNLMFVVNVFESSIFLHLVMPLGVGDLYDNLPNDITTIQSYFRQICQGVQHLHTEVGYEHGDISLENVLIFPNNNVMVMDYGQACPIGSIRKPMLARGKDAYSAPELRYGSSVVTGSCDVFSIGVILFSMLSHRMLFDVASWDDVLYRSLQTDGMTGFNFGPAPSNMTTSACELITGMTRHDPQERWGLSRVLDHPWVQDM